MKQIQAVIIDDEIAAAENISILLDSYCPEIKVIGMQHSIPTGYKLIKQMQPDLVFLDISMPPEGTGFDLLDMFPNRNFHVIFVTAHQDYGLKAIKQRAFDYLLKPIDYKELIQSMTQFTASFEKTNSLTDSNQEAIIKLSTDSGTHVVKQQQILYCKASGSYTEIHIKDRSPILISKSLKFAEAQLNMTVFKRIHRSYIVNPRFITKINKEDGGNIFLGDIQIPVSKNYCEDVFDLVN